MNSATGSGRLPSSAGGTVNAGSSLAKYKQRIALYEAPDDPLAPLTASQRQFILDLTHGSNEREIPQHLKRIPTKQTVEMVRPKDGAVASLKDVAFEKFNFHTKQEVST